MDAPALEVEDLRKTYRDGRFGRRRIEALGGVTFRVRRGEIFGLLGPNGAGKTTLIKVLLGIVRGAQGKARLLDRPAGARSARRHVGYLPENHRVARHHTAATALRYFGGLSGIARREIATRSGELLELVGLAPWRDTPVRKFSKGMQQRLGVAQALVHNPDLLMLDEPTDGVDPVGRAEMRNLMQRLKAEGKTIFLNSHLLQELELVCDRVVILDRGRVLREGRIDEITRLAGQDARLILAGQASEVRAAIGEHAPSDLVEMAERRFEVTLREVDQASIDRTVDELRARGVSILEIAPVRRTLEEAFLSILETSRGEVDA